jgi:hypothetical protein
LGGEEEAKATGRGKLKEKPENPDMLSLKKLPKLSLMLLLVTYTALGWILSASKSPWYTLLLAAALVLLLAETLAAPFSNIRKIILRTLSSDINAFVIVLVVSFLAAAIVIWIDIVIRFLVLVSAGLLARLDLYRAGLGQWQAFWILTVICLIGFALGWTGQNYLYPDPIVPLHATP